MLQSEPSRPGEVDDDNAWVLDGVAGHAGLFGTATEVARFGQRILEELGGAGRVAPAALWERAVTPLAGGTYGLGFDTPSSRLEQRRTPHREQAPRGLRPPGLHRNEPVGRSRRDSSRWPCCTNRTALGRDNVRIQQFRPRFHDAVVEALGLGAGP